MGNGNGEPAALWEVCRAFKGLKKNSMCATGLKKAGKKIKSNQHPYLPQAFASWHVFAKKCI